MALFTKYAIVARAPAYRLVAARACALKEGFNVYKALGLTAECARHESKGILHTIDGHECRSVPDQMYYKLFVCKIPLLARALGLKAATRPSARATIGYLVYNMHIGH